MHVRLTHGTWAAANAGGVRVGILDGDLEHGWQTTAVALPQAELPALVNCLNIGGVWTDGTTSITAAAGCARLQINGRQVLLSVEATARLQILCQITSSGARRADSSTRLLADVSTVPGGLTTDALPLIGDIGPHAPLRAVPGGVVLGLTTSTGPVDVLLPALDCLVAALEASHNRQPVGVTLARVGRDAHCLRIPSADMLQVAADGQWLLPALTRPVDTQA